MSQILIYFMLFCPVWIARRTTRHKLAKPQTYPLEKPRGSHSGLRCFHVFWMSLYKDYIPCTYKGFIAFFLVILHSILTKLKLQSTQTIYYWPYFPISFKFIFLIMGSESSSKMSGKSVSNSTLNCSQINFLRFTQYILRQD